MQTGIRDRMIAIATGNQIAAIEMAMRIDPDDVAKANAFASQLGGWDIVATRFPELLADAGTDEIGGKLAPNWIATLLGITALCRANGYSIHI